PIAFPREEGEVVVVELEIRRVFVAKPLDGVVQAGVPAPMWCGEACRREARVAKHAIRTFQIAKVGLGIAINVVKMTVRLGVVAAQVAQHLAFVLVGMSADEMSAAICQQVPGQGEPVVIVGDRLIEIDPEVEGGTKRVGERGQPDPGSPAGEHLLAKSADHSAADPGLGLARHALAQVPLSDSPGCPGILVINECLERIDGLLTPQQVNVDGDMLAGQQRLQAAYRDLPAVEEDKTAPAEGKWMRISDCLVSDALLGQDQLQARRGSPEQERQGSQNRAIEIRHGHLPEPEPTRVSSAVPPVAGGRAMSV